MNKYKKKTLNKHKYVRWMRTIVSVLYKRHIFSANSNLFSICTKTTTSFRMPKGSSMFNFYAYLTLFFHIFAQKDTCFISKIMFNDSKKNFITIFIWKSLNLKGLARPVAQNSNFSK